MDDLCGGDDIENPFAVGRASGMAGVVQGGLNEGDAGVFVGDVVEGLGCGGAVV